MISKSLVALLLSGTALPLTAFASDCAHVRNIDLALDLDGVETIAFEVHSHDLRVRIGQDAGATLAGRACASSDTALDDLRVVQERNGDTLEVRLERDDGITWNLFGNRYATIDVTATLPPGTAVRVDVGYLTSPADR